MRRGGVAVAAGLLFACATDEHPDTGYGGNAAVPAQITCAAACSRLADCVVHLCNEDTASSKYDGLESLFQDQCDLNCDDTALAAELSATEWNCTYVQTCRRVLEHDTCNTDAHYTCGD